MLLSLRLCAKRSFCNVACRLIAQARCFGRFTFASTRHCDLHLRGACERLCECQFPWPWLVLASWKFARSIEISLAQCSATCQSGETCSKALRLPQRLITARQEVRLSRSRRRKNRAKRCARREIRRRFALEGRVQIFVAAAALWRMAGAALSRTSHRSPIRVAGGKLWRLSSCRVAS